MILLVVSPISRNESVATDSENPDLTFNVWQDDTNLVVEDRIRIKLP